MILVILPLKGSRKWLPTVCIKVFRPHTQNYTLNQTLFQQTISSGKNEKINDASCNSKETQSNNEK